MQDQTAPGIRSSAARRTSRQDVGFTLIPTLILLLAVALIGSATTQWVLLSARSLTSDRQHQIAYQAARAALDDAMHDMLNTSTSPSERSALFRGTSSALLWPEEGCGSGPFQGLCAPDAAQALLAGAATLTGAFAAPASAHDWQAPETSVPFGHFTSARYPMGPGMQSAAPSRYRIERLQAPAAAQSTVSTTLYRVTALGFGPLPARIPVLLQAELTATPPPAESPASSMQLREIAFRQLPPPQLDAND